MTVSLSIGSGNVVGVVGKDGSAASPILPSSPTPWVRNPDWPTMPSVSSSEEKVVCLIGITRGDDNYISFQVQGNYTVNWGDGTSNNYSSNAVASHYYDYNTISGGTFGNGTKSAFITITPQAGSNLTYLDFHKWVDGDANHTDYWSSLLLEIKLSVPNATRIYFTEPGWIGYQGTFIEAITFVGQPTNLATDGLFRNIFSLRYVSIDLTGNISTSYNYMFENSWRITNMDDVIFGNASSVMSTYSMFGGCYGLIKAPSFDTSAVTDARYMFNECWALQEVPVYNMASATDIGGMYRRCQTLKKVPGILNTGNVTSFSVLFAECYSLEEVPNLDMSSGTYLTYMFQSCYSLVRVPDYVMPVADNTEAMFLGCIALQRLPNFNLSTVTYAPSMFQSCWSIESVPEYDFASLTNMSNMFYDCRALRKVNGFKNTGNNQYLNGTFKECYNLKTIPLFDTSAVIEAQTTFQNCYALTTVPLFNFANLQNAYCMFQACRTLESVPLFNFSKVTNFGGIFDNCWNLLSIPAYNTSNGVQFNSFASNCYRLESFPMIDTSKGTDFTYMVTASRNLKSFPAINTSNGVNLYRMFESCQGIKQFPVLDFTSATNIEYMFYDTFALTLPNMTNTSGVDRIHRFCYSTMLHELPAWDVSGVTSDDNMYFDGTKKRLSYSGLYGGRYQAYYKDNLLSANSLNTIFTNLGTAAADSNKLIYIGNNPGSNTCNTTIATNKGWTIVN